MSLNLINLNDDPALSDLIENSIAEDMARPAVQKPQPAKTPINFAPLTAEPTPKEFLAQEAVIAQRQLAVVNNNRKRLLEIYSVNSQRQKIMREELAKLDAEQKTVIASIRANDRAAAIQRKAIFDLQEAGR